MRKLIISIIVLSLLVACVQEPIEPVEPIEDAEEAAVEEEMCAEMWICLNKDTKAYRKSDCTFEQITDCPAGCENGECKEEEVIEEETKLEEQKIKDFPTSESEEPEEEKTKESCTLGYKCLDENRRGYQSSNCMFSQVLECKYGCKDGECITEAPPEEEKEEIFSLTKGTDSLNRLGKRYCDFSKNQIFQDEVYEQDLKLRLYAKSSGYDYLRADSYSVGLWVIEKGIKEAIRSDCMEEIGEANAYGYLRSGQTLCIETREDNIALVGGYWEGLPDEYTELSWKYYS